MPARQSGEHESDKTIPFGYFGFSSVEYAAKRQLMRNAMHSLNDNMPATVNLNDWWTDDDGTSWPPCLAGLIKTRRHRTRLRERATAIGSPQLVAYALHWAHRTRPIVSLDVLKQTLDHMEEGGYDFTETLGLKARATRQERFTLPPAYIASAAVAPLAKVYRFPGREVEPSVPHRTPQSISCDRMQHSRAGGSEATKGNRAG